MFHFSLKISLFIQILLTIVNKNCFFDAIVPIEKISNFATLNYLSQINQQTSRLLSFGHFRLKSFEANFFTTYQYGES